MNLSKVTRALLGVPVFALGLAMIAVEALRAYTRDVDIHFSHAAIAFVLMYIGGAILNSALAESIADNLVEKLDPILNRIPGGRRKTDPPPPPEPQG